MIVVFLVVAVRAWASESVDPLRPRTSQLFHGLNRWFSTRHALKAVEIPHETDRVAHSISAGSPVALFSAA